MCSPRSQRFLADSKMYLAKAKAGHDKGSVYVVIEEDETFVYLSNGTTKPLSRPKKKKKIHIQPIYRLPEEIRALSEEATMDDCLVKRILKLYGRHAGQALE